MRGSRDHEFELHITPAPVLISLPILGVVLYLMSGMWPQTAPAKYIWLAPITYGLAGGGALVARWRELAGRWFALLATVALAHLAALWLGIPGAFGLAAVIVALAAALINLPAAATVTGGETLLLAWLLRVGVMNPASVGMPLLSMWTMLGVLWAVYHPIEDAAAWSWDQFRQAQALLEEARGRKAELAQALDDLVHANRQLALANERMATLRQVAEEAQKAKAAFVARVSHEFRTPLNIIIGMANLVLDSRESYEMPLPAQVIERLRILQRNSEHLAAMIDDVLDLSQVEAGRMTIHREPVDLVEVIEDALAMVQPMLAQKGLTCRAELARDLPRVPCDRLRIRQVILNLTSNAARFTERGGIAIRLAQSNGRALVSVADTGPGITAEDLKRIFEPFSQGTGGVLHGRGSSGLGLSISNEFVKLHGGRMWVESAIGQGSTFFVELPLTAPAEHIARPDRWIKESWIWYERNSHPDLPRSHYRPRLVVYDEGAELQRALARRSGEIEFVDAHSLPAAIDEIRRCPAQALVLNSRSPSELWPALEEAKRRAPDTPIVGCCCSARRGYAMAAGAGGYLSKPVKRTEMQRAIEELGRPVGRVLVVDDDADARELLKLYLQGLNPAVEVVEAEDGQGALQELRRRPPDLILLDLVMPGLDGWQVLRRKSEEETLKGVPTILISAQDALQEPVASPMIVAAMGEGLSVNKILDCACQLSAELLQPD